MIIQNGIVFTEEQTFEKKELYTKDGKICASKNEADPDIVDATGMYVIPGLVDVHTHGAVGHDFCDASVEGLLAIAKHQKSCGVTSFCATSMTVSEERLLESFRTVTEVPKTDDTASIVGIHMEGPFLCAAKKGAQNGSFIRNPDVSMFRRLNKACGNRIRLVTIAPELFGTDDFISELKGETTISIGHSAANYDQASQAFSCGASHVTHLFNAMPPFHHRDPGIIGAASDDPHVMVEVICDGIHIHPSVIRNIFRIFGDDRVILISDSVEAAGMADGAYELGGQTVYKNGNRATLEDGTLAGSATNLADCMRTAVSFGIPLVSAVKAATCNPAKSIGMENQIGNFHPGCRADVLLLDSNLRLVRVIDGQ